MCVRWEVLEKWGVRTLERLCRCRFIPHILALSAAAGWELLSLTAPPMKGCSPETPQRPLLLASSVCFVFLTLTVCTYLLLTSLIQCANCSDDPNTSMHEHKHTHKCRHTQSRKMWMGLFLEADSLHFSATINGWKKEGRKRMRGGGNEPSDDWIFRKKSAKIHH